MKAAVLHQLGTYPTYEDFSDPVPTHGQQVLVTVRASSIKQLDKLKASGKHYTSYAQLPTVVGTDGAGILEDGTRIYASGLTGMLAEKALVHPINWVKLPDGLDFETAAALPNALIGSDAALVLRANIQKGQTVLINGATGFTGKVAVQMAKYRGASKVIATGRNADILGTLSGLGADEVISLEQPEEAIVNRLKEIQHETPIDVVMDYLWGQPMLAILTAFAASKPYRTRVVLIGEMAGATIPLPSGMLRSSKIELLGSGIGGITLQELGSYLKNELPPLLQLAADGQLKLDIETLELKDISSIWQKVAPAGKRIVVKMD